MEETAKAGRWQQRIPDDIYGLTEEEIQKVLDRAEKGNESALPLVRKFLDLEEAAEL